MNGSNNAKAILSKATGEAEINQLASIEKILAVIAKVIIQDTTVILPGGWVVP